MRILHAPNEIASNMRRHADAQRALGHEVTVMEIGTGPHSNGDIMLHARGPTGVMNNENRKKILRDFLNEHLLDYDVYHFYFRCTILEDKSDLEILRKNNKVVIMNVCGSDVANNQNHFAQTYFDKFYRGLPGALPPLTTQYQYNDVVKIDPYLDTIIAASWWLDYVPRAALMPRTKKTWKVPIDRQKWENLMKSVPVKNKDPNKVYILHATTNRMIKGTEFVLKTWDDLKKAGYPIEPILVENVHPSKVHEYYAKADIVISQILEGWYGSFACEMMALGKPVICRIDPYFHVYEGIDPPLVDANPHTLYDTLVRLIENRSEWEKIGSLGREYVEEYHDYMKIGQDLIELYDTLLHKRMFWEITNTSYYKKGIQTTFPTKIAEGDTYKKVIEERRIWNFDENLEMVKIYKQRGARLLYIAYLERCVELKPDFLEGIKELAILYLNAFRYRKAKPYIKRWIELKPEARNELVNEAQRRTSIERYHDAITLLEILSDSDPQNPMYHSFIGSIYQKLPILLRAEIAYIESLKKDAAYERSRIGLKKVYEEMGKPEMYEITIREIEEGLR